MQNPDADPLAPPDRPERIPPEKVIAQVLRRHVTDIGAGRYTMTMHVEDVAQEIADALSVAVPARAHHENFFAMAARVEQEETKMQSDEKDVERQLTQEWEDAAKQAQSSMERLGRLADHFRRGGWAQCARELEEALTTIQHEATREVRASTSNIACQGSVVLHRIELKGTPKQIEMLVAQKCENLKNTIMAYVRGDLPIRPLPPQWNCPLCGYGEYKNREDWKLRAVQHVNVCIQGTGVLP